MKVRTLLTVLLVASTVAALGSNTVLAKEFRMGNVDRSGSRSIPDGAEGPFTRHNVTTHGLRVRWSTATDAAVMGSPATFDGAVYVGDISGYVYAFDKDDGTLIWQTCVEASCPGPFLFSGLIGSPLIKGKTVYIGTLSGSLVALDAADGSIKWTHTPVISPPFFNLSIDSIWGGPISVRNTIVYALAPNDEFGLPAYGRGAVIAVNAHTGVEVWRRPLISDADHLAGASGAGVWNTTPTYSPELDLVFVGTGQDTNPAGGEEGSDSFFAIDGLTGQVVWQTQVRTGDTWNYVLAYDPLNPTDTDIGDSPAVFKVRGRMYVAAGDKRGIFWVLDATDGTIVNNGGAGLDLFDGVLPGPGLTGGFNLDAGYLKTGNQLRHFTVFADQTTSLQNIVDTFPGGVCYANISCPIAPDSGNLVVLSGDGTQELCRFSAPATQIFSPLQVAGMVVVRGAENPTIFVVDIDTCDLVASFGLDSGPSAGANLSFANGVIYTGGGLFGTPGLTAVEVAVP